MNVGVSTTGRAAVVADSRALDRLYVGPVNLARFEVDAGSTNRSNVRVETMPRSASSGALQPFGSPSRNAEEGIGEAEEGGVEEGDHQAEAVGACGERARKLCPGQSLYDRGFAELGMAY